MAICLKSSFICRQVFGTEMISQNKKIILDISSELGIIAPNQRIYRKNGLPEDIQPVETITYSIVKHGIIRLLTKYLAIYWADKGIRLNNHYWRKIKSPLTGDIIKYKHCLTNCIYQAGSWQIRSLRRKRYW